MTTNTTNIMEELLSIKPVPRDDDKKEQEDEQKKKKGGGPCGSPSPSSDSSSDSQSSDSQSNDSQNQDSDIQDDNGTQSNTSDPKRLKLEIEENDIPENWWDKLPDFDPRVYDAIMMEKAAACVDFIFQDLPDMHEIMNNMTARGFRKICPRLKTKVPRTKVIKPTEIVYDTIVK